MNFMSTKVLDTTGWLNLLKNCWTMPTITAQMKKDVDVHACPWYIGPRLANKAFVTRACQLVALAGLSLAKFVHAVTITRSKDNQVYLYTHGFVLDMTCQIRGHPPRTRCWWIWIVHVNEGQDPIGWSRPLNVRTIDTFEIQRKRRCYMYMPVHDT